LIEKRVAALAKSGLSLSTINKAVQAVTVPTRYFCRMHRVTYSLQWVEKEPERPVERGTITLEELRRIVASKGRIGAQPRRKNQKSGPGAPDVAPNQYAAILLGALCGLRAGEVRGLQFEDVDEKLGLVHIRHNFVDGDELKAPKWDSTRTVPAPEPVIEAVRACREIAAGPFVFYSQKKADAPGRYATVRTGFVRAMQGLGISKEEQKARNLSFHGLRHTFITLSRSAGIPDWLLKRLSGHRTDRMLENYSHSDNVLDFAAARESMTKILEEDGVAKVKPS
jgi:integrase